MKKNIYKSDNDNLFREVEEKQKNTNYIMYLIIGLIVGVGIMVLANMTNNDKR